MKQMKQIADVLTQVGNTTEWVNDDVLFAIKQLGHHELANNLYELNKLYRVLAPKDEKSLHPQLPLTKSEY